VSLRQSLSSLLGAQESAALAAAEAEIAAELEHHLAACADGLEESGLARDEAEHEARRRFGDPEVVRDACVRTRMGGWIMTKRMHQALTAFLALCVLVLLWSNYASYVRSQVALEQMHAELAQSMAAIQQSQELRAALDLLVPEDELVIGVGDVVEIVFEHNRDETTIERVARDGMILVPAAGWVRVGGRSRDEAEREVNERLQEFYADERVHLVVDPYVPDDGTQSER